MPARLIKITDTILRDAHQSLLATRMCTEDMLPVAEQLDRVGYYSLEAWGGATFDACLRYLHEDPWGRLRTLRQAFPRTPLQMLLRGQNLVGYRHYADDVVEKFVELAAQDGVEIFRVFDALNDVRNLGTAIRAVKRMGKHAQGAICYTMSPVHNTQSFLELARELVTLGVDSLVIKDMAGLLSPYQAQDLVTELKKHFSLPLHVHSHCTSGMATAAYLKAIEAGADGVDTAISSMALGTSQPPTESLVAMLQGTPYDPGLDLQLLAEIADHFQEVRKKYREFESQFLIDTEVLTFQVPGGMLSNLEHQLRDQQALHRLPEVLAEIPRVREDLGYPPLVTPTSQIVGTQATLNVLLGRYSVITKETKDLLRGSYGRPPGEVNPDLVKQALGDEERIICRPADLLEPELERMREQARAWIRREEDLLTYTLFPQVALKFFEQRDLRPGRVESVEVSVATADGPTGAGPDLNAGTGTGRALFRVRVNQRLYEVEVEPLSIERPEPTITGLRELVPDGDRVTAALPGNVLQIRCGVGDRVTRGQPLITLEAMKMETQIVAPRDGVVAAIQVKVGDPVQVGETLLVLQPGD